MKKRYLYVGAFVNKRTNELLDSNERKIGVTNDLTKRENDLNATKCPIGYQIISAWDFGENGDAYLFEQDLHDQISFLSSRHGEWFDNEGIEDYVRHLTKNIATEVELESLDTTTESEKIVLRKAGDKVKRARVLELAGQKFYAEREGVKVEMVITENGRFLSLTDGIEYSSPNMPFKYFWRDKISGSPELNGWTLPKNERKNSIEDELDLLPEIAK